MPVERIPGEKMYIDWVGDTPHLLVDPSTGEILPVHVFATTLGVSSLVYAEIFLDEKLPSFIAGTVHALQFYGGIPKYLVPDNCRTAVKKHSKDELILNSAYQDLEDFYDTIILPPPPRKPKGKPTIEGHVRYLETHLLEKLKEGVYTSPKALNDATQKIIADINQRQFQKKVGSRKDEGVDGLFIGPNDLSVDLDCLKDRSPLFDCIRKVAEAAQEAGKPRGIITTDKELISFSKHLDVNCISYGSELNMLINGSKQILEKI